MFAVNLEQFKDTLVSEAAPAGLTPALLALWHDAKGDWEAAHRIAQDIDDATGAWVHAYLHRKEGDAGNASYWYRQASQPVCRESLDVEWSRIVSSLLANS